MGSLYRQISKIKYFFRADFSQVLGLIKSEFRLILSDIAPILLCFGVPILYPIIYPMGFYANHDVVRNLPVAAVDLDKTSFSAKFIRMADDNEYINVASRPESLEEAKRMFDNGTVNGIFVVPANFGKSIMGGAATTIPVYADASLFYIYKQVFAAIRTTAGYMSAGVQIQRFEAKGMSPLQAALARAPIRQISMPLYNPSGSYVIYIMPGILFLILHQCLFVLTGVLGGIRRERGLNAEAAAICRRSGECTVIFGRMGAWLAIFLAQCVLVYFIFFPLHGLPRREAFLPTVLFVLPMLIAVACAGITLSAYIKTKEMAFLFYLWLSIPIFLLSGCSWPLYAMPAPLPALAQLLPATPALNGLIQMLKYGATFGEVFAKWLHLWSLSLLYLVTAVYSLRRLNRGL